MPSSAVNATRAESGEVTKRIITARLHERYPTLLTSVPGVLWRAGQARATRVPTRWPGGGLQKQIIFVTSRGGRLAVEDEVAAARGAQLDISDHEHDRGSRARELQPRTHVCVVPADSSEEGHT